MSILQIIKTLTPTGLEIMRKLKPSENFDPGKRALD